jgi:hypothetical protein
MANASLFAHTATDTAEPDLLVASFSGNVA